MRQNEIELILFLQGFTEVKPFFLVVSETAGDLANIFLFPIVYWFIDRNKGFELCFVAIAAMMITGLLKGYFEIPRPFVDHNEILMLIEASGYTFPSGHALSTTVFWGFLALNFKTTWVRYSAVFLILFVPVSRIYLGVHYPADVLAGVLIGALILLSSFYIRPLVVKLSFSLTLGIAITAVVLLFFLIVAAGAVLQSWLALALLVGLVVARFLKPYSDTIPSDKTTLFLLGLFGYSAMGVYFFAAVSFIPLLTDTEWLQVFLAGIPLGLIVYFVPYLFHRIIRFRLAF